MMEDDDGAAGRALRQDLTVVRLSGASGLAEAAWVDASAPASGSVTALKPGERRGGLRQGTRLRSGKLIGADGCFLCECLVNNRSRSGRRLKLPSATIDLPPSLFFYDDQSELLFGGRIIWRRERELGLRLLPCASNALHRSILGAMRRKSYILGR